MFKKLPKPGIEALLWGAIIAAGIVYGAYEALGGWNGHGRAVLLATLFIWPLLHILGTLIATLLMKSWDLWENWTFGDNDKERR